MAPLFSHAWYLLGNALLQQDRVEEAIQAREKSISLNPKINDAYYQLGLAMEMRGDLETAASYFRQALEISPKHRDYRKAFQEVQIQLGR